MKRYYMTLAKYTLHTAAIDGSPFNSRPAMLHELNSDCILCNEEPILPGDSHCYNMRLWVIGNEFGACCAVWASHEQDALDNAVDANMLDSELLENQDEGYDNEGEVIDGYISAGNAGELFHSDYLFIHQVEFDIIRDWELLKAFARCSDNDTLDY
jgi:hypothetical protein